MRYSIISVLLLCAMAMQAQAATITVINTNDSGPGSLRQALVDANDGDTIDFAVTGTIGLTSGELLVNKVLTISGPGAENLAVNGNARATFENYRAQKVFERLSTWLRGKGVTAQKPIHELRKEYRLDGESETRPDRCEGFLAPRRCRDHRRALHRPSAPSDDWSRISAQSRRKDRPDRTRTSRASSVTRNGGKNRRQQDNEQNEDNQSEEKRWRLNCASTNNEKGETDRSFVSDGIDEVA